MEHNFSALSARTCKIETNAVSASSVSGSARSWPLPGQVDGSTAVGSHDPGSSEEGRNTRRRLEKDTGPDDENARSTVPLRFPCEQCHAGISVWLTRTLATADMPAADMPFRIQCKTGTTSARLVFSTRAKFQDFLETYRDDGLTYANDSSCCNTNATFMVRQSKSPEDREIGRRSKPLWKVLAPKLQEIFTDKDVKGIFIVPALDYEHKSSAYTIAEMELENRSLVLLHLDTNKGSMPLLLVCAGLIFLMMCCNRLLVMQAIRFRIARPMCDGCPLASSPGCPLAGQNIFLLCGFSLCWLLRVAFCLCRRQPLHEHEPRNCEVNQTQCSRPYGTATYFLQTAIWLGTCQSILTQVERSNEPVLVCHRVSLSAPRLAGPWDPCPSSGRWLNKEDTSDRLGNVHLGPPLQRWRRDALQPPAVPWGQPARDTCVHVPTGGLRCVSWNTRGLLGSTASSERSRELNHIYLTRLAKKTTSFISKRLIGKDEFFKADCLVPSC